MPNSIAYIGLGSNLDNPYAQIQAAASSISALPEVFFFELSPIYRSLAVGPGEQPDYLNAVARITTSLAPLELLKNMQFIECQQLRRRDERWGPRTIDLDILLVDQLIIRTETLIVPHPYLTERNFVLVPLHDLCPELVLPCGATVQELMHRTGREGLWPWQYEATNE